jgi:transglutaminase-like putative cysteine protease
MTSRAKTKPIPLTRQQSLWLIAAAGAAVVPLTPQLPPWLATTTIALLIGRGLMWRQGPALPTRWLTLLLAVGTALAVALVYGNIFGREPGVALLVLFVAVKLFEARRRRDALAVILLAYFLQIAHFFESQSPLAAALALGSLIVVTAALIAVADDGQRISTALRRAALLLTHAVPFMVILFLLFPRVHAPLWGMPSETHANTGLSETMTPGSISNLSLSPAIAFRVKFDGAPPPSPLLYWRGPVLSHYDGTTWTAGPVEPVPAELPRNGRGPGLNYTVTLEPHHRLWLFALELPGSVPPQATLKGDYQLIADKQVSSRLRYALHSYPQARVGAQAPPEATQAWLQLPAEGNPRSRALAQGWRAGGEGPEALAQRALMHFRRESFVYSLTMIPLLGADAVDGFLFESRRGFCEHYASAFVFLMRAAGVPARVVTGYQGGEVNPVDGYLIVRQSDAHAWAEIWVAGEGWLRVDPTAAVAPSRIEHGLAGALAADESLPTLLRADAQWLRSLRFRLEAWSNLWDQWVLGYNQQRQHELLQRLGMREADWRHMTVVLSLVCGALMLVLAGWAMRQHLAQDPVQRAWARLSRKLARAGLPRAAWEGPLAYADRVAAARPRLAEQVRAIAEDYGTLRYGGHAGAAYRLKRMNERIRNLVL